MLKFHFMHRLWNNTLLQILPKVDYVEIASRAKIYLPPELSLQQNRSDDKFEVSVWYLENRFDRRPKLQRDIL